MKLIGLILKNIKNLIPYLLLIALYFFFINLERIDEQKNKSILKSESELYEKESSKDDKKQKIISIPVLPYSE